MKQIIFLMTTLLSLNLMAMDNVYNNFKECQQKKIRACNFCKQRHYQCNGNPCFECVKRNQECLRTHIPRDFENSEDSQRRLKKRTSSIFESQLDIQVVGHVKKIKTKNPCNNCRSAGKGCNDFTPCLRCKERNLPCLRNKRANTNQQEKQHNDSSVSDGHELDTLISGHFRKDDEIDYGEEEQSQDRETENNSVPANHPILSDRNFWEDYKIDCTEAEHFINEMN